MYQLHSYLPGYLLRKDLLASMDILMRDNNAAAVQFWMVALGYVAYDDTQYVSDYVDNRLYGDPSQDFFFHHKMSRFYRVNFKGLLVRKPQVSTERARKHQLIREEFLAERTLAYKEKRCMDKEIVRREFKRRKLIK